MVGLLYTTTQPIGKIVKKFEDTAVHIRFGRSVENIAIVGESVAEDQNVSIPQRSQ